MLKNCVCWGLYPGGAHSFLGILLSCYRRTGICSVHICAHVSTHWCHNHQGCFLGIRALTQPGCWQPTLQHQSTWHLDPTWGNPSDRHRCLYFSAVSKKTTKFRMPGLHHDLHGGRLSGVLKNKLNNLGVWARQKFPSVICQLKPTSGRHFACSSKITVVR